MVEVVAGAKGAVGEAMAGVGAAVTAATEVLVAGDWVAAKERWPLEKNG